MCSCICNGSPLLHRNILKSGSDMTDIRWMRRWRTIALRAVGRHAVQFNGVTQNLSNL